MPNDFAELSHQEPIRVVVAIPARYASTRLFGKPLAMIGDRPMIQHVFERAARAKGVTSVLVATDDERIAQAVRSFNGNVVLTRTDHPSGTDRLAEVFADMEADVVINVQGDEPFLEPEIIEALIKPFLIDPKLRFATLKTPITDPADLLDSTIAKVVVDKDDFALYFSRSPIPFLRDAMEMGPDGIKINLPKEEQVFKQVGLYGYRRDFLLEFSKWAPSPLELLEKLEQLRALHHGVKIKVVTVAHSGLSVDTPADLERARTIFNNTGQ